MKLFSFFTAAICKWIFASVLDCSMYESHKRIQHFTWAKPPKKIVFSVADTQLSNWCQSVSQTVPPNFFKVWAIIFSLLAYPFWIFTMHRALIKDPPCLRISNLHSCCCGYTQELAHIPSYMLIFWELFRLQEAKKNSNEIVVKLWNGSMALEISRDGVDCKTNGPMF